jgi:molybdate transport system ATP-binding protein
MVAGLSRPDRGRITIGDRCCFDGEKGIHLPPEKRRIGYVFQEARLFPHLSVQANLTFGMNRLKPADRFVGFDPVVSLLGIESLLKRRPARLSGGEKQRVAIGRALLCSPALLLMDEPLASLDQARKEELLPYIRTLSTRFRIPILYVSHQMEEIACVADAMVRLENGRVTDYTPVSRQNMPCPGMPGMCRPSSKG